MQKLAFLVEGEALSTSTTFLTVTPNLRLRLATTIENLIALLDEIDGDENIEEENEYGGDVVDELHDEETDCNLAGACSDLEADDSFADTPGFIWGGLA